MLSSCNVDVCGVILLIDLIMLDATNFDVILGIDWLALHYECVDCHSEQVSFCLLSKDPIVLQRDMNDTVANHVSTLKGGKMVKKRRKAYLAYVRDVDQLK